MEGSGRPAVRMGRVYCGFRVGGGMRRVLKERIYRAGEAGLIEKAGIWIVAGRWRRRKCREIGNRV